MCWSGVVVLWLCVDISTMRWFLILTRWGGLFTQSHRSILNKIHNHWHCLGGIKQLPSFPVDTIGHEWQMLGHVCLSRENIYLDTLTVYMLTSDMDSFINTCTSMYSYEQSVFLWFSRHTYITKLTNWLPLKQTGAEDSFPESLWMIYVDLSVNQ